MHPFSKCKSWDCIINRVVSKSVSRFARNTVDSLTTIRKLKENGVEVYFEKESIWTFQARGEILLTILSSLSQEEVQSISENVTWGLRKKFQDGKFSVGYSRFLGYDKGEDGNLAINEEQAKTVRLIFGLFIEGLTPCAIAKELTKRGILTVTGKSKWNAATINGVLANEKYTGCARIQKTFTPDFLTKKVVKNTGQVPSYFVEQSHTAIIDPAVFEMVQREMERRSRECRRYSGVSIFSGKIKCGDDEPLGALVLRGSHAKRSVEVRRLLWSKSLALHGQVPQGHIPLQQEVRRA